MDKTQNTTKEKHSFLTYIFTIFLSFLALAFSSSIIASLFKFQLNGKLNIDHIITTYGKNTFFVLQLLPFLVALIVLLLCIKFIHKMNVSIIFTSNVKFNFKDFSLSFFILGFFLTLILVLELATTTSVKWNFSTSTFFYLLLICSFFISIQTLFEEVLFRSYLMIGFQKAFHKPFISIFLSSILFGLMHMSNPEIGIFGKGIIFYFIYTGIFLSLLRFYSNGIEISFGFHLMNNLFATLILTNNWQVFQTDAVFKNYANPELGIDFWLTVFFVYPIIFIIFMLKNKWKLGSIFVNQIK